MSYDSREEEVQKDAENVAESLKAMAEFMKAMNSKTGRKKIMRTQSCGARVEANGTD